MSHDEPKICFLLKIVCTFLGHMPILIFLFFSGVFPHLYVSLVKRDFVHEVWVCLHALDTLLFQALHEEDTSATW